MTVTELVITSKGDERCPWKIPVTIAHFDFSGYVHIP